MPPKFEQTSVNNTTSDAEYSEEEKEELEEEKTLTEEEEQDNAPEPESEDSVQTDAAQAIAGATVSGRFITEGDLERGRLTGEEIRYPDVVPADPRDYRRNLDGLLLSTGKKTQSGHMTPVTAAVGELNSLMNSNFQRKDEGILTELDAAYDRTIAAANEYVNGRKPWTKTGKKRRQIIQGLLKFVSCEKLITGKFWTQYVAGHISEATFRTLRPEDMFDGSKMGAPEREAQENTVAVVKKMMKSVPEDVSTPEAIQNRHREAGEVLGEFKIETRTINNPRMDMSVVKGTALLRGDTPERSLQVLRNITYDPDVEGRDRNRSERVREIERTFETILSFDTAKLRFQTPNDLRGADAMDGYTISLMIFDMQNLIKEYGRMVENPEIDTALSPEQHKEIKARYECFSSFKPWVDFVVALNDPLVSKYCPAEKVFEMTDVVVVYQEMEKVRKNRGIPKESREMITKTLSNYMTMLSGNLMPGKDPNQALEEWRVKVGGGADLTGEALEAIRRYQKP